VNQHKDSHSGDREVKGQLAPLSAFLPGLADGLKIELPAEPPKVSTPQKRHHFTTHKQLDELIAIPQDNAEMGFMTRLLTLCSLPRTDPGNRLQYKRENGPYKLVMIAGGDNRQQAPLRRFTAFVASLGLHRGRQDAGPRVSAWAVRSVKEQIKKETYRITAAPPGLQQDRMWP
jgi:hypothetical protein